MATILVVEDDELNQELAARFLRRDGHVVFLAGDGEAGVATARAKLPDLILMDLSMPKVDGWEATRLLKSHQDTANIPIIALTAHAFDQDIERALLAGFDHYETKPLNYFGLRKKIHQLLGK